MVINDVVSRKLKDERFPEKEGKKRKREALTGIVILIRDQIHF